MTDSEYYTWQPRVPLIHQLLTPPPSYAEPVFHIGVHDTFMIRIRVGTRTHKASEGKCMLAFNAFPSLLEITEIM